MSRSLTLTDKFSKLLEELEAILGGGMATINVVTNMHYFWEPVARLSCGILRAVIINERATRQEEVILPSGW